jgi:hypothetical protein
MAGMKPRHATALALVVWYLMGPAPMLLKRDHPRSNAFHGDSARTLWNGPPPAEPIPGWTIIKTFPTRRECKAQLRANPRDRCIASNDPRLKEK